MAGLQAHAAGLADSNNDYPSGLALSGLILLFGERDADLRHGAAGRAGGVLYKIALLVVDEDRLRLAIGRNGVTGVGLALSVVDGEL